MKQSKFSEEQMATALRHVDAGAPVLEVTCKRLRQLEEETNKLKQLVADLTLDKVILQEVLATKA
jgi:putative transposase